MNTPSDLRDTFFQECEDLLDEMAQGLRALDPAEANIDTINSIFRAVHSIKGGAGAFKLALLVEFAHGFETLLDELRSGAMAITDDLLPLMHRAGDHLADMVIAERDEDDHDHELTSRLKAEIHSHLPEQEDDGSTAAVAAFVPTTLSLGPLPDLPDPGVASVESDDTYHIRFRPSAELYSSGNEPALLLRELADLGDITVTLNAGALPDFSDLDVNGSYLAWDIELKTDQGDHAIHQVFEFVEATAAVSIEKKTPALAEPPAPPDKPIFIPETSPQPALVEGLPDKAISSQGPAVGGPKPQSVPKAAARKQPRPTIRVDLERVDRLINIVGELIIHQAMLTQAVEEAELSSGSDITSALDELKQLSRDIQESVMAIRAQPVKPLFERMYRIVREASDAASKSVQLVTEGDMTEVDKTVVEKLADPLTHMVRNAVDHGLETATQRLAAGKPEQGIVTLSAGHRSGRVLITISDDGGGINREKVLAIAVEKGLVAADADLSEAEIDNLLFLPGFSTATEVSSLSGRGVGMDVVKSAITSLGGRVAITSVPGKGTTFSISLPLTLAVLDGMVVDVAGQQMVFPITTIIETLRPPKQDIKALGPDNHVVSIRGNYLPILDVGDILGFREPLSDISSGVALLIETEEETRAALLVDNIHDQRQVVIKSLQENYGDVPGVAAATVFGDGRVALIVDPSDLIEEAAKTVGALTMAAQENEVGHAQHN